MMMMMMMMIMVVVDSWWSVDDGGWFRFFFACGYLPRHATHVPMSSPLLYPLSLSVAVVRRSSPLCRFLSPPRYGYPFQHLLGASTEVDRVLFNFFSNEWWHTLPGPFTDLGNYALNLFDISGANAGTTATDVLPKYGGWIVDMPTVLVDADGVVVTGCTASDPTVTCTWAAGTQPVLPLTAMLQAAGIPSLNFNNVAFVGSLECPRASGCTTGATGNAAGVYNRHPCVCACVRVCVCWRVCARVPV